MPVNFFERLIYRLKQFLLWLGIWTLVGFGFHIFTALPQLSLEQPISSLFEDTHWDILQFYIWGLLSPIIIFLVHRYPIEQKRILRSIFIYVPLFFLIHALFVIIHSTVFTALGGTWVPPDITLMEGIAAMMVNSLRLHGFIYIPIVISVQALSLYRSYQTEKSRAATLQTNLAEAELQILKEQLNPHFLFNTLNAISALVHISPVKARMTISELSDLLRMTLHKNKAQEVTLKEELDFLRKYLQIQKTLLEERLEIKWTIEPETLDALVPSMLLQPLVENSIRHGIAPKTEGGHIEIFSRRVQDNLLLEIKDNGITDKDSFEKNGEGIGLINSKVRLRHLYADAHRFDSSKLPGGIGWRVSIIIPFREQPEQ